MGERVIIHDEEEGWAWGQLQTDGYVGYLPSRGVGRALGQAGPAASQCCAPLSIPART